MTPRRRYEIALLSLGWLILAGVLVRGGIAGSARQAWDRITDRVVRAGQSLSDAEGKAWSDVRGESRRELVANRYPALQSIESLRRPASMLPGAYDGAFPHSFDGLARLESQLGFHFPIISFYQAWGDRPDQRQFPLRMAKTIDSLGSVPMITWEPWVKDFDETIRTNLPPVEQREYASLAAIARGEYDFYVTPWAAAAAQFGKPIFLRFAHEMNDPYRYPWGPQNGNRPDDLIAACRHVHLIFQKMGATNVLWVWSPHISMPWFEFYYPGDEYVDWIGTGILNYGTVAPWSRWWTFHQILEKAYPALEKISKPIMITEFGSLSAGGDPAEWYRAAFADMHSKYPGIRSVVFFNQPSDTTLSTAPLNWSLLESPRTVDVVRSELHRIQNPEPTESQ